MTLLQKLLHLNFKVTVNSSQSNRQIPSEQQLLILFFLKTLIKGGHLPQAEWERAFGKCGEIWKSLGVDNI